MILKRDAKFEEKTICFKNVSNLHCDWSLLRKVYNVWSKQIQRSYLSWHWRVMQNLKKNCLVLPKMTWRIWQTFNRTLEFPYWDFHAILLSKVENVWAYNSQGSYVSWQWRIMKKLKRIDLSVQNWHEEFGKFWPEHLKF